MKIEKIILINELVRLSNINDELEENIKEHSSNDVNKNAITMCEIVKTLNNIAH